MVKPILFSGPMVRAILEGRKTQTRRVIKPQPSDYFCPPWQITRWDCRGEDSNGNVAWAPVYLCRPAEKVKFGTYTNSPYGKPGDTLWVRETWAVDKSYDNVKPRDLWATTPVLYIVDGPLCGFTYGEDHTPAEVAEKFTLGKTRPSIFMPRWASRIDLPVIDVRIERLQDISEEDAVAEGISETRLRSTEDSSNNYSETPKYHWNPYEVASKSYGTARGAFTALWHSINGKRPGCSWEDNPWVWVIEWPKYEGGEHD